MKNLPDPRGDGQCYDCEAKPAVTADGRFCLKCLRRRIREETPDPRSAIREQKDRRQISSQVLGGTADMNTEDEP